jgi:hypothetical protein
MFSLKQMNFISAFLCLIILSKVIYSSPSTLTLPILRHYSTAIDYPSFQQEWTFQNFKWRKRDESFF